MFDKIKVINNMNNIHKRSIELFLKNKFVFSISTKIDNFQLWIFQKYCLKCNKKMKTILLTESQKERKNLFYVFLSSEVTINSEVLNALKKIKLFVKSLFCVFIFQNS